MRIATAPGEPTIPAIATLLVVLSVVNIGIVAALMRRAGVLGHAALG